MSSTTLVFLAVGTTAVLYLMGFMFTLYEFSLMRRKPHSFPKTFAHLHPED